MPTKHQRVRGRGRVHIRMDSRGDRGIMNYEIQDITYDDIRRASDNWLRAWLKEDLDPEIHDMISYELFEIRETRRSIT